MWHIGSLVGTGAGIAADWALFCSDETVGAVPNSEHCTELMTDPEHLPIVGAGLVIGLVGGFLWDLHEHP
jgi:hypothetical protein